MDANLQKMNKKPGCREVKVYLLVADDLGDAGSAVNVGAVRDDGQVDGVQAHGALLVGAAGQHHPQLFYQTLPQLCRRRRPACMQRREGSTGNIKSVRLDPKNRFCVKLQKVLNAPTRFLLPTLLSAGVTLGLKTD